MEKKTQKKKIEPKEKVSCTDKNCPEHGKLSVRGRVFEGTIIGKQKKKIVIEFDRSVYIKKYERYTKKKTKIHAHLPDCKSESVDEGDYVRVKECRPISKMKHFVFIKKIR